MARLVGPDEGSRLAYVIRADNALSTAGSLVATVYADQAATVLADILTYPGGAAVAGSRLTVGSDSLLPLIQYPDGSSTVYVSVNGGPVTPVYARGAFGGGGGGGTVSDATVSAKGIVQLAGDLGGTAAAPTVPGLAGKAPTTRQVIAGTGLTGGGDLTADRTLTVAYGTTAGTAAQGNDSRITGAATRAVVRSTYITSGDITVTNVGTTWTYLPGLELSVPAAVGDYVELVTAGMFNTQTTTSFLDLVVVTGAGPTIARRSSSGSSAATASNEGEPAFYPTPAAATNFKPLVTTWGFTVTAPDLDSGSVRFGWVYRGAGTTSKIMASANYPLRMRAINRGQVS